MIGANVNLQMAAKDELIMQLQKQIEVWKNKYDALAKLYSQLRGEHLDLLNKSKGFQLKANSAQEAIDKMERMERDVKSKNLELADMIRERDRARYDLDRLKSVSTFSDVYYCFFPLIHSSVHQSHREEVERIKRDLAFANERAEDASRNKSSEVTHMLSKYNRQLTELEDSLRVRSLLSSFSREHSDAISRHSRSNFRSMICFTSWTRRNTNLAELSKRRNKNWPLCRKEWTLPCSR